MIATVQKRIREEVGASRLENGCDKIDMVIQVVTPCFGGEKSRCLHHPFFHSEVENDKIQAELAGANEATMSNQALLEQIVHSPRNSTNQNLSHISPLVSFGMYLGGVRRRKQITLADLAAGCRVSVDLIARIELGEASLAEISEILPAMSMLLGEKEQKLARLIIDLIFPNK